MTLGAECHGSAKDFVDYPVGKLGISVKVRCFRAATQRKKSLTCFVGLARLPPHTDTTKTKMRTKTLLLTAALAAVGATTASAQVYSVNAVGYINVDCPQGFSMIANQLDAGAGNNTVSKLFPGVPAGTIVYKFASTGYVINSYDPDLGGWDQPDMPLVPGEGCWFLAPSALKVTFVGEVMQGSLSTPVPQGFAIKSSQVPQAAALGTVLNFPVAAGDIFYFYRAGAYQIFSFDPDLGGWDPSEPSPNVGESFWTFVGAAKNWTRNFSVNQ